MKLLLMSGFWMGCLVYFDL